LTRLKYNFVTFPLEPNDQVVPVGKRISLMSISSDRGFTVHPKPSTQLTLDLKATTLSLPVVVGLDPLSGEPDEELPSKGCLWVLDETFQKVPRTVKEKRRALLGRATEAVSRMSKPVENFCSKA
jgi:hypothetical protein